MNKLKVEISTPERSFFEGEADTIITRTINGNIGIKANHAPLVTILDVGKLKIKNGSEEKTATINTGFLEIKDNLVSIFADSAEWPGEINKQRAEEAKIRAERRLKEKTQDTDLDRAELALKKAINRINIID